MSAATNQKVGPQPSQAIDGYHIRLMLTPAGSQGSFLATTHDRMDAANRPSAYGLSDGTVTVQTSQIFGDHFSYTLRNVEIASFEAAADSSRRGRIWTYRFPSSNDGPRTLAATLTHSGTLTPRPGPIGDDLLYGIEAFPQRLLGFRARTSHYEGSVFEFVALRNGKNGMLNAAIAMHNTIAAGKTMPPLEIKFAQGNLTIDVDNLNRLYVEESTGTLLQTRRQQLVEFVRPAAGPELFDPPTDDIAPADLLSRWLDHRYLTPTPTHTVERLVVVFNAGYYKNMSFR